MDYPIIVEEPNEIIVSAEKRAALLEKISNFVKDYVPDVATDDGRREMKSLAYKITRTKTAVEEAGRKATEKYKKIIADITAVKDEVVERIEVLRDDFRKPLTDWEEAEKERERKRKEIRTKLEEAVAIPRGMTSEAVAYRIADINKTVPDDDDFKEKKAYCLQQLEKIRAEILEDERREQERKELDERAAKLAAEKADLEEALSEMRRQKIALEAEAEARQKPSPPESYKQAPEPDRLESAPAYVPGHVDTPTLKGGPVPGRIVDTKIGYPFAPPSTSMNVDPYREVRPKLCQIMHPSVAEKLIGWIKNEAIGLTLK